MCLACYLAWFAIVVVVVVVIEECVMQPNPKCSYWTWERQVCSDCHTNTLCTTVYVCLYIYPFIGLRPIWYVWNICLGMGDAIIHAVATTTTLVWVCVRCVACKIRFSGFLSDHIPASYTYWFEDIALMKTCILWLLLLLLFLMHLISFHGICYILCVTHFRSGTHWIEITLSSAKRARNSEKEPEIERERESERKRERGTSTMSKLKFSMLLIYGFRLWFWKLHMDTQYPTNTCIPSRSIRFELVISH